MNKLYNSIVNSIPAALWLLGPDFYDVIIKIKTSYWDGAGPYVTTADWTNEIIPKRPNLL